MQLNIQEDVLAHYLFSLSIYLSLATLCDNLYLRTILYFFLYFLSIHLKVKSHVTKNIKNNIFKGFEHNINLSKYRLETFETI